MYFLLTFFLMFLHGEDGKTIWPTGKTIAKPLKMLTKSRAGGKILRNTQLYFRPHLMLLIL